MKDLLNKTSIKTILLSVIPIVISFFSSVVVAGFTESKFLLAFVFLALFVVFVASYIALLCFYAKTDANLKAANKRLRNENNALKKAVSHSVSMYKKMSEALNSFSKSIIDDGQIDLNIWSFDKNSMWVREAVHELLKNLNGEENAYGVSYVKLIEKAEKSYAVTVGFANDASTPPHVFGKERDIDEKHAYFDTKVFKSGNPEIVTMDNSDRIYEEFEYENKKDKSKKYSQYIGIPVLCENRKIIGLLQVVSYEGSLIASNNKELREIAKKFFVQFAYFSLLSSKTEKGLISLPSLKVKK